MNIAQMIRYLILKLVSPTQRVEMIRKDRRGVKIGSNCEIYEDVYFDSEPYLIEIGNNVRIARGVTLLTHDGGMWVPRNNGMLKNADAFGKIKIGNNVHIGMYASIMPSVTIGDNVIIGVGAIVTKDIPPNSIAAGVPAKVIETLDEYYIKHKDTVDFTKHMNENEKRSYLCRKYQL